MSDEPKFCFIVSGRNVEPWVAQCLWSLSNQSGNSCISIVLDDPTDNSVRVALGVINDPAFKISEVGMTINGERKGALRSQVEAFRNIPEGFRDPETILVWVDADDYLNPWLAGSVLIQLAEAYNKPQSTGGLQPRWRPLLTYGNYKAVPATVTDGLATPYHPQCVNTNGYRNYRKWGVKFNHLRTMKYKVMEHIVENHSDHLRDRNGDWGMVAADSYLMTTALELVGHRHLCLPTQFVCYRSNNPVSDWRVHKNELHAAHKDIQSKPKLKVFGGW